MARLNYYGIELALQEILQADPALANVSVYVEEDQAPAILEGPAVIIYLEGRTAPPTLQTLSAGLNTRMELRLNLWCYAVDFETWRGAQQKRDELIGIVELTLMRNRDINGLVNTSWLEGGSLSAGGPGRGTGWVSSGEIILVADATASN